MVLTKVAHNDAKSLKKIGCIFPHRLGGWGGQTLVWKIPQNFYFSYFVSFPYQIIELTDVAMVCRSPTKMMRTMLLSPTPNTPNSDWRTHNFDSP